MGLVRRPGCRKKASWRQRLGTTPSPPPLGKVWLQTGWRRGARSRTTGFKDQTGRCVICLSHSGHGSLVLRGGDPTTTFPGTTPPPVPVFTQVTDIS